MEAVDRESNPLLELGAQLGITASALREAPNEGSGRRLQPRPASPNRPSRLSHRSYMLGGMAETDGVRKAAVSVERIMIRNFRGIRELDLHLRPGLTLLVGRNNVGKSRILRALRVGVGGARAERDDLTVGSSRRAEIDVVAAPRPPPSPNGGAPSASTEPRTQAEEVFDRSVSELLGGEVSEISLEPLRQRFAWRTTITSSSEDTGAQSQSHIMTYDLQNERWYTSEISPSLKRGQRNIFAVEYVGAQRDLAKELQHRGSALRRILNDLNVSEEERGDLERKLSELGEDIVNRSGTLRDLRSNLETLNQFLDAIGEARVNAVPDSLEELARTIGVSFGTDEEQLAARLQGSGVLSLASLQVQDLFYRLRLGSDGPDLRPHAITLVEEPEAHLHPHAVYELPLLLENQKHQVIATTHSSQLATVVNPRTIKLIREPSTGTHGKHSIVDLAPVEEADNNTPRLRRPELYDSEMEKLKRLVERPFGDLLFARAIVIGDGATERAFLPPVLRNALGPLAHGVSVVDSGGIHTPLASAVIRFAQCFDVPFLILADNDSEGRQNIEKLKRVLDLPSDRVVWLRAPKGKQNKNIPTEVAIERMLIEFDLEMCQRVCKHFRLSCNDKSATFSSMIGAKGYIGSFLAQEFVMGYPYNKDGRHWPETLRDLVEKIRQDFDSRYGT